MKTISLLMFMAFLGLSSAAMAQPAGQPKMSPEEQKMAQAIMAAPDTGARVKAATEFIKKFPKSVMRPRIARAVADQIASSSDPAQVVTLAQSYQTAFNEPAEQEIITPVLIEALSHAKRTDEAFATGTAYLAKNPDSLQTLIQLLSAAAEEAKQKNGKYAPQSIQYGTHAIQIIESGNKPANLDDVAWAKYKTDVLPSLYQSLGLLHLVSGAKPEAVVSYTKAAELAPTDPFSALMLAELLNDSYQTSARNYQKMQSGPAKDEELKKTQTLLDRVIEAYAHSVALSEGNANYASVRQQHMQDLETYYKYRHNGSTTGLQELINKYKPAAKP